MIATLVLAQTPQNSPGGGVDQLGDVDFWSPGSITRGGVGPSQRLRLGSARRGAAAGWDELT